MRQDSSEPAPEEAAACVAEEYERDHINAPKSAAEWAMNFSAAIRAWLNGNGIVSADRLTAADIAAVARANAKKLASGEMRPDGEGVIDRLQQKKSDAITSPQH